MSLLGVITPLVGDQKVQLIAALLPLHHNIECPVSMICLHYYIACIQALHLLIFEQSAPYNELAYQRGQLSTLKT